MIPYEDEDSRMSLLHESLKSKIIEYKNDGSENELICFNLGVDEEVIEKFLEEEYHRIITPSMKDYILDWRDRGKSIDQISREMTIDFDAVKWFLEDVNDGVLKNP